MKAPPLPADRVRQLLGTKAHTRIDNLGRWSRQKLTPSQRIEIRDAHSRGEKCEAIAQRYGVSVAYVSMIGTGARKA